MQRLKVAVIGFGVMGAYHANVYAALPHTELIAIVDPLLSQRRLASSNYAVASYGSLRDMLAVCRPDAVSIVTPTSLHYELAKACLEAGIHVLVEKPVATELEHAHHLIYLSRKRGLVLQVGHITRFYSAVQLLKNRVSSPYLIDARRLSPNGRVEDVGVVLDLMIHDIDIVLGLIPYKVQELMVSGQSLKGQHEDVAAAQILFENGAIARFLASRVAPISERSFIIYEEQQSLRLDFGKDPHTEVSVYRSYPDEYGNNHIQVTRTNVREDNPLRKELEHFLARIHHNVTPIGTLEDDLRSLELATTILQKLSQQKKLIPSG
ncbi:MAG: Gfo/Idh/MocA family oxidoreductase [Deinococcales bacterium]